MHQILSEEGLLGKIDGIFMDLDLLIVMWSQWVAAAEIF
jgi:hypothetical protein